MNWLNIETRTLHDPAYIGSEPKARATWLNVILWCASQENGGIIDGAANWKCRQWQQTCGVTKREVEQAKNLLSIEGESVVVWKYPLSKEAEVQAKRQAGRQGGLLSGASRASSKSEAALQAKGQAVLERKGKEGERKEKGKEEGSRSESGAPDGDLVLLEESAAPKSESRSRQRDPLFDALAKAEGSVPEQLTQPAARSIGVALANIRRACPELTVEEIERRAKNYRREWPKATLTASALAKNWARFGSSAPSTSILEERFAKAW